MALQFGRQSQYDISLLSSNASAAVYTYTATVKIVNQQGLSIGNVTAQTAKTAFSGLTPSQAIYVGSASITLSGTISSGTLYPPVGETVSISINGSVLNPSIGSNGTFNAIFPTATIPVPALASSSTYAPYIITYTFAGDATFSAAKDTPTSLTVKIAGDVDGDGVVNGADLSLVKASFGKQKGQRGFDPRADVKGDGIVNVLDLAFAARQVPAGTTCNSLDQSSDYQNKQRKAAVSNPLV